MYKNILALFIIVLFTGCTSVQPDITLSSSQKVFEEEDFINTFREFVEMGDVE